MEDAVFGLLTFNVGWIKEEKIHLWDKDWKLKIRTSSKKGELPSEIQQKAYLTFKSELELFSQQTLPLVKEYISSYSDEIGQLIGIARVGDPLSVITPEEVLFFQNGKFALLCDTKWSEAGMAVLYDSGAFIVDDSYILEFEY